MYLLGITVFSCMKYLYKFCAQFYLFIIELEEFFIYIE